MPNCLSLPKPLATPLPEPMRVEGLDRVEPGGQHAHDIAADIAADETVAAVQCHRTLWIDQYEAR